MPTKKKRNVGYAIIGFAKLVLPGELAQQIADDAVFYEGRGLIAALKGDHGEAERKQFVVLMFPEPQQPQPRATL